MQIVRAIEKQLLGNHNTNATDTDPPTAASAGKIPRCTVLAIDDDPSLVHLMIENLESQGYDVISGYDGSGAQRETSLPMTGACATPCGPRRLVSRFTLPHL